jgi:two-component system CheB/CheR fusion protein
MTFVDITERKMATVALEESRLEAERANIAKTRFLAAASHDLRQPLQTMTLLNRMLTKVPPGASTNSLLAKLDDTTTAMTGILNTLLDINQIDAGIVKAEMVDYPIDDLLSKLAAAFVDLAESRGLKLHFVPSRLNILTDPRILEQMLRNLISNALKYTEKGGILLGCRRHGKTAEIQVWDTGLGVPEAELNAIFEEYHQVDNPARERSRGLGLGLSIVQRLGILMDHKVSVRSVHGKGSVFSIEVSAVAGAASKISAAIPSVVLSNLPNISAHVGKILVIEDDPDIRQLLEMFLTDEGHQVATARDGHDAIALIAPHTKLPDLILSDYNLPDGVNGLEVTKKLREMIGHDVAVVIVTGDISSRTMKDIAAADCVQLNKPMKLNDLNDTIQYLLADAASLPPQSQPKPKNGPLQDQATIYVIDDDTTICSTMHEVLEAQGYYVETFISGEAFLSADAKPTNACLLLDANLPGMSGFDLLKNLPAPLESIQAIMITGQGDIKLAVQAIKSGAFDFIEKPVGHDELLVAVSRALERSKDAENTNTRQQCATAKVASLTPRQRQIMHLVLAGEPSKIIAADLGISQRTVENHRASIMKKTATKSLPALARLAMAAASKIAVPCQP